MTSAYGFVQRGYIHARKDRKSATLLHALLPGLRIQGGFVGNAAMGSSRRCCVGRVFGKLCDATLFLLPIARSVSPGSLGDGAAVPLRSGNCQAP